MAWSTRCWNGSASPLRENGRGGPPPAAGMTHEEVHKTAELVREINRTKALIVVEHDMQFIRMIAKQVTVFNQGSVLVEDAVENILRNPLVRDIYLGKQAAA